MSDTRPVFFFDIDNTIYPRSSQVQDHVVQLIDQFCVNRLNMSYADAKKLHADHYQGPGLAVERLSRLHQIDALEYNRLVDDAIPLESIIKPDPELQSLLESIDKTKVKLWLFTNAYVTHGQRVVKVMGVDQYFEGITFSDYAARPLLSKPDPKMFEKAMQEAGAQSSDACYLVDDSPANCRQAEALGWHTAYLLEDEQYALERPGLQPCRNQIQHLRELRRIFPQFFISNEGVNK